MPKIMTRFLHLSLLLLGLLLTPPALAQFDGQARTGLGLGAATRDEPLPLAQAFPFYVSAVNPELLRVTWEIAPGHYLYRHAIHFSLQLGPDAEPVAVPFTLPEGEHKTDQFFGEIEAYYTRIRADVALPAADLRAATLIIQYQGCAEWGFCYPPQQQEFRLTP